MEAVEAWGEALHLSLDLDFGAFNLSELADSRDTGATIGVENANSVVGFSTFDHLKLN